MITTRTQIVRTIFEGTATLLSQSGAPSHCGELAQKHFVVTKNVLVEQDIGPGGTKVWVSPSRIVDPKGWNSIYILYQLRSAKGTKIQRSTDLS
jgi:hypothetical protein